MGCRPVMSGDRAVPNNQANQEDYGKYYGDHNWCEWRALVPTRPNWSTGKATSEDGELPSHGT